MRIAIFARYPTAGEAKTRLIPAIGAAGAAGVHRVLVERTLGTVKASGLPFEIRTTGANPSAFIEWLGDVPVTSQGDGDLGARLARVPAPTLLIGADCPDLTAEHLQTAAAIVATGRPCIGSAEDGGYWLLGLPTPRPDLFEAIEWGTNTVFAVTHARIPEAQRLPVLADLDRPEDLKRWPDLGQ